MNVPTQTLPELLRARFSAVRSLNSLRFRAIRAGFWTICGYGANQVLRLGGNLLLTRLLFPEAFGLMALVMSVMVGLSMFLDVGVEASIIQNKRGHEESFINAAWTVQVVQGAMIWLALCILGKPAALFYKAPMLAQLLPVAGLAALIGGFGSTRMPLAARNLALKRRVLIEVASYALGLVCMVIWAWITRSIWSLVGGNLIGALAKTVASHYALPGVRNRWTYEKSVFREIFGFGQWVLLSSAITYIAGEGNKLLVGAFLGVKVLAFFTLASTFSGLFWQVAFQLNSYVLFPAYSEIVRTRPQALRSAATRIRLMLLAPAWLVSLVFVFFGDRFMHLLYDQRYVMSGSILQMLSLGQLIGILGGSYVGLLWARGLVSTSTALLVVQVAIQILGMVLGNHFWGPAGVIVSTAAVGWLIYPVSAFVYFRLGLWEPRLDLPIVAVSLLIAVLEFHRIFVHL
ncbi:MAG TPA: oligosaccharide flippase family protein [Steroidobacteraceae bacterium]|nr:oligosaccharide flippase family protein [Steroidobacteraceae bacterium]